MWAIAELLCNSPHGGSPHPPLSTPIYVSACGVDKKLPKWQEIQLAMYCGVGSLNALISYTVA